jgi:MFS family permease
VSDRPSAPELHGWSRAPVLAVAGFVLASGFGQFGAIAALGDVAEGFGEVVPGDAIAERAGLSGTQLGVGLAVIRLASVFCLPLAALADRVGRRVTLMVFCGLGLLLTAAAALSPGYWWFVALFALSRPFLTATDAVGGVAAAEQTASGDRAKAMALVAAAYGLGSGLIALSRGVLGDVGFRGVFALALLPLLALPFAASRVREPDRYRTAAAAEVKPLPVLGAVGVRYRSRLLVLVAVTFAVSVVTGPANSFVFLYVENLLGFSSAATATMVLAAAPAGLVGLIAGRWAADVIGRRATAGGAMALLALAGITTYSGSATAAVAGYLGAVAAGALFAPAAGALAAELFPTSVRAAVAGWILAAGVLGAVAGLLAFGMVADAYEKFGDAALWLFTPTTLVALALVLVPETKGRELEDWAEA